MTKITRSKVTYALAESMREFGYPDFTDDEAGEVLDAYVKNPDGDLPHGIVGMMLKKQLDDLADAKVNLKRLANK